MLNSQLIVTLGNSSASPSCFFLGISLHLFPQQSLLQLSLSSVPLGFESQPPLSLFPSLGFFFYPVLHFVCL